MRTTATLAKDMNASIFYIFEQDVDDVITVINFYVALGDEEKNDVAEKKQKTKINDGFWDF